MYSSEVSDTYEYEYDEDDFDDSDEKSSIQRNSQTSKNGINGNGSDRKSERGSNHSGAPSDAQSQRDGHKSISRLTKSPSSLFEHVKSDVDSFYSEPTDDVPQKNASRGAYSEVQQTERNSRNTGFSRRSMPNTSNTMYGNRTSFRGKKSRLRNQPQKQPQKTQNPNVVVKRVLSASRNKTHALQNLIMELQSQVDELRIENRDLKRAARLQEREIKRLDNDEADLPMLLQKHSSETRILREKLRRQKENVDKANEELKKRDLELLKVRDRLKKCEDIIKDKNLDERDKLHHKVEKLEEDIDEKQQKIMDLEKSIRLHEKLRNREIKEKNDRYKKVVDELTRLGTEFHEVQRKLREKEKELEVKNIYTRSINIKMKHGGRRNSLELEDISSPVSTRKTIRSSSPPDSILLSDSLRESQPLGFKSPRAPSNSKKDTPTSTSKYTSASEVHTLVSEQRKREAEELKEELRRKQEEIARMELEAKDRENLLRKEMESRLRRDKEELEKVLKAEQERKEGELKKEIEDLRKSEERERRRSEELAGIELERREKEREDARRRMEKEEKDINRRKELEELERRRQEEARIEEEENRRRQDEERRKQEEERRKQEEERRKQEEEWRKQESENSDARRKKELLLARMKAIDEGKSPDAIDVNASAYSPTASSSSSNMQKKPIFLQSDTNSKRDDVDGNSILRHGPLDFTGGSQNRNSRRGSGSRVSSGGSMKSYSFKATDENLHNGLPAYHGDDGFPKPGSGRRRSLEDSPGIYKPPTGSPSTARKSSVKAESKINDIGANETLNSKHQKKDFANNDEGPIHGRRRPPGVTAELDDPVFGSYAPTFLAKPGGSNGGKQNAKTSSSGTSDLDNAIGGKQAKFGRRARGRQSPISQDGILSDGVDSPSSARNGLTEYGQDYRFTSKSSGQSIILSREDPTESSGRHSFTDANSNVFTTNRDSRSSPKGARPRQPKKEEISEVIDDLDDVVHL